MSLYQFILNTKICVCCHFYNTYTVYLAHIYSAHVNRHLGFISCVFFFCLSVEFSSRGNVSGNLSGAQLYLSASCCGPECVVFSEYTGAVERYSYYSLT